jgi:hypothetical protein
MRNGQLETYRKPRLAGDGGDPGVDSVRITPEPCFTIGRATI